MMKVAGYHSDFVICWHLDGRIIRISFFVVHCSVAPMMDWTTNNYRTLARLIPKHAWLYTEMIAAETIVIRKVLGFSSEQHPIVLQIGGSNLENIAKATKLANAYGYDEINFNCGCPSPRVVGHGCFGVRLMLDPKVGDCILTMLIIAWKIRLDVLDFDFIKFILIIGIDDRDSYNELCDFIYKVFSSSLVKHFIIHSRKALLNGISPAKNRSIPPLKYEYYYGLLCDFLDLKFTVNGGINTIEEKPKLSPHCCGRNSWSCPWQTLGLVDSSVYGDAPSGITCRKVLEEFQVYGDSVLGIHGTTDQIFVICLRSLKSFRYMEILFLEYMGTTDQIFVMCLRELSDHDLMTVKSLLEETLDAILDWVLDSPVVKPIPGREDLFSNVHNLMPPSYTAREPKLSYA
ncbi:hypothetical protein Droror1_Dr00023786 [Drosera rotundifolia]